MCDQGFFVRFVHVISRISLCASVQLWVGVCVCLCKCLNERMLFVCLCVFVCVYVGNRLFTRPLSPPY